MTKKRIVKNFFLTLALIPGILVIIVTMVAIRMTDGMNTEEMRIVLDYISEFNNSKQSVEKDIGIIYILNEIKSYAHWIITACAVYITFILYLIVHKRRIKDEKKQI